MPTLVLIYFLRDKKTMREYDMFKYWIEHCKVIKSYHQKVHWTFKKAISPAIKVVLGGWTIIMTYHLRIKLFYIVMYCVEIQLPSLAHNIETRQKWIAGFVCGLEPKLRADAKIEIRVNNKIWWFLDFYILSSIRSGNHLKSISARNIQYSTFKLIFVSPMLSLKRV